MTNFTSPPTKQLNDMLNENNIIKTDASGAIHVSSIAAAMQQHEAVVLSIKSGVMDDIKNCITSTATHDKKEMSFDIETVVDNDQVQAVIAKWINDINAKEEECLKNIHARYCIPRALQHKAEDLSRVYPDEQNKNRYQYWFKHGKPEAFMLMERELVYDPEAGPKLNIFFNQVLAREGE